MPSAQKTVAVTATSGTLLWPKNPKRTYLTVQNQSAFDMYINIGATPSVDNGLIISAGDEWSPVNPPRGDIRIIGSSTAGQKLYSAEESQ